MSLSNGGFVARRLMWHWSVLAGSTSAPVPTTLRRASSEEHFDGDAKFVACNWSCLECKRSRRRQAASKSFF